MKYALIDIGSNSIRLNVYNKDNIQKEVFSKKYMAGLAGFVEDGKLSDKGIKKLIKVLSAQKMLLDYLPIDEIYAFASASLRNVDNGKDIVKKIKKELNLNIDLISAEEEALYGVEGMKMAYDFDNFYTIDIGGGSTEICYLKNKDIKDKYFLKAGSLSLFRDYVENTIPSVREYDEMINAIDKVIANDLDIYKDAKLVASGGTARALGNIFEELDNDSDKEYTLDDVKNYIYEMIDKNKKTIRTTVMVVPERLHSIVPGAILLYRILKFLNIDKVYVSKLGVREGYLKDKIIKEWNYGKVHAKSRVELAKI